MNRAGSVRDAEIDPNRFLSGLVGRFHLQRGAHSGGERRRRRDVIERALPLGAELGVFRRLASA